MKKLIANGLIILLMFANSTLANQHDYYMQDNIFFNVEYRDLFIEELKKRNIMFLTNKKNPNHLAIRSNNSGIIEEISKIASSKESQHIFSDLYFKDKFLKLLNENNIPYIENVISENPPDYRIRVDEKDVKQSNLLIEELLNN